VSNSTFYSDRAGAAIPRVSEDVSANAWRGIAALIQARIRDGSLARAFPHHGCPDGQGYITGTDEKMFLNSLRAYIPSLDDAAIDPGHPQTTMIALDIVDFVALRIDLPSARTVHPYFGHEHLSFSEQHTNAIPGRKLNQGQTRFRDDIDLLFARNGIAFTLGGDMRVGRLGPPEARRLISDFKPNSGDAQLDSKLNFAMSRFLSRVPADRQDALEKLWDAFELVRNLEVGGQITQVKQSVTHLLNRAAPGSLRAELEAEFKALNDIGNSFSIRHHGGQQQALPSEAAVDYLFIRLASVIAFVLRQTGRMTK
jgi:hypothetical protein